MTQNILSKKMTIAALGAALTLTAVNAATPAFAAPKNVNNKQAAHMLSMCMLEDDYYDAVANPQEEGWVGCCSKTLGYCIECPTSGRGQCNSYPAPRIPVKTRPKAPESGKMAPQTRVRDHRQSAKGGVEAVQ